MTLSNLTHEEITGVLPPEAPGLKPNDLDGARAFKIAHFDAELVRLADSVSLLDAWRGKLDLVRPPAQPKTLQDLVAQARDTLRRGRLGTDRVLIDRRIELVTTLRTEIAR
ncbi:hypothetical protein [Mesorhizobium sp. CN2-181]|uniref:hypothetical protein n=1 Tax=Mesorhizobium yinganensis TaxID=3157707 RepID=UPI0032B8083C